MKKDCVPKTLTTCKENRLSEFLRCHVKSCPAFVIKFFCLCQKSSCNWEGQTFKIKIVEICPNSCFQIMLNSSNQGCQLVEFRMQGCQIFSTTWRGQFWAYQLLPWPAACGTHDPVWSEWQPSIAHNSTEKKTKKKRVTIFEIRSHLWIISPNLDVF